MISSSFNGYGLRNKQVNGLVSKTFSLKNIQKWHLGDIENMNHIQSDLLGPQHIKGMKLHKRLVCNGFDRRIMTTLARLVFDLTRENSNDLIQCQLSGHQACKCGYSL